MSNSILLRSNATFEPHLYADSALPFTIHRRMRYPAGGGCRSNLHRNIELLHIISGCGTVICGDEEYPVVPGDTVVVNSYLAHRIVAREDIVFNCLIVGSDFCGENGIDTAELEFVPKPTDPEVSELFEEAMTQYDRQDSFWQARMRCAVLALLIYLCENSSHRRQTPITEEHVYQAVIDSVAYIRENLQSKLSVEQIAEQAGFSKYYFLRLFKRVTGCTVVQYINLLRCEYAKELLRSGNSVKQTALRSGFENMSYFTGVFKRHVGCLPNAYRAKSKN